MRHRRCGFGRFPRGPEAQAQRQRLATLDRVAAIAIRKLATAEALGFDDALKRWLATTEGSWAFSEYCSITDRLAAMDEGSAGDSAWLN